MKTRRKQINLFLIVENGKLYQIFSNVERKFIRDLAASSTQWPEHLKLKWSGDKTHEVLAGPDGSGKTTIFKGILAEEDIQPGTYVNADDIESDLTAENSLSFDKYKFKFK